MHLLLRTGTVPIASIMRRLLTGYAVRFNPALSGTDTDIFSLRGVGSTSRRQNRYKSILCEEDGYLNQLVAYIHLNPFRAGSVADVAALKIYPFTGHSALMGKSVRPWQDTAYVLTLFGRTVSEARRNLQRHVLKWSAKGRCPEWANGGLVLSAGGWGAVKEAYRDGIRLAGDERILGSSEFVEIPPKVGLKQAGEAYNRRMRIQSADMDLSGVITAVCRYLNIDEKELAYDISGKGASKITVMPQGANTLLLLK